MSALRQYVAQQGWPCQPPDAHVVAAYNVFSNRCSPHFWNQLKHAPGKGMHAAKERLNRLNHQLQRTMTSTLTDHGQRLDRLNHRLQRSMDATVAQRRQRLAQLGATLQAAHPKRVLERGYSMVQDQEGEVISDIASLKEGQTIQLQFADGQAAADVHTIEPLEDEP